MLLHDDEVLVADTVFDINRGEGKVISVADKLFEVDFSTVRVYYNSKGIQRGKSLVSLFWSPPYIIYPRKSEPLTINNRKRFVAIMALIDTLNLQEGN